MPNLFHRIGDTVERISTRIGACTHDIALHIKFHRAVSRGNDILALQIMRQITMADLTALTAAVDRVVAKSASDANALADAVAANANLQPDIDAQTARLDAIAPVVESPIPVEAPAIEPPVLDLNPNA